MGTMDLRFNPVVPMIPRRVPATGRTGDGKTGQLHLDEGYKLLEQITQYQDSPSPAKRSISVR